MADQTASQDVVDALKGAVVTLDLINLGKPGSLDAKTYKATAKLIEMSGGKWNRGKKGHYFPKGDAKEFIANVTGGGKVVDKKKKFQAFFTPEEVVDQMIDIAGGVENCSCLEPEAGEGWIVRELIKHGALTITAVELNEEFIPALNEVIGKHEGWHTTVQGDFLTFNPDDEGFDATPYDRIIMNPPFTKDQDIKHIRHALDFLRPGGNLTSLSMGTPAGRPKMQAFLDEARDRLGVNYVQTVELEQGTHRAVGTDISTTIVSLTKD